MSRELLGGDDEGGVAGHAEPVDLDAPDPVSDTTSERRRLRRRPAVVGALVAALLLGGGAGAWIEHRQDQRAQDRQSAGVLLLTASPGAATSDPSGVLVQVVLTNEGSLPVDVLGVGVDLPGVYVRAIDPRPARIAPGGSRAVQVHAVVDCYRARDAALSGPGAAPAQLEVRARTADGQTRTLTVAGRAGDRPWESVFAGLGCGSGDSALALSLDGRPAAGADRLQVPLRLTGGARALRVLSLRPQLGRTAATEPSLPFDLPAGGTTHLVLTVGPPRCDLLARGDGDGVAEQLPDGVRVTFADAAGASADRPAATQVLLPLGPAYGRALAAAVRAACPA
ncbi:MAG: hypothetical protein ACTHQ3_16460 [Motilibacteraceae bacterium]